MLISGNRLRNVNNVAAKVGDDQQAMAGCLVLARPQFSLALPGPARPQRAIYQGDCSSDGVSCFLRVRPELPGCLVHQRGEERDVPRYRGLVDVKDLGPDLLVVIVALVSACNDERLVQGNLLLSAFTLPSGLFKKFRDTLLKLVKLLSVQP